MAREYTQPYSTLVEGGPARPYLRIEISNRFPRRDSRKLLLLCLLDTGADWNLLPPFVCDVLGHRLEDGEGPYPFIGVGGVSIDAYIHTNRIRILDDENDPVYEGDMLFYIAEEWESPNGLFGHEDFFRRFPVFFDTERNYFTMFID